MGVVQETKYLLQRRRDRSPTGLTTEQRLDDMERSIDQLNMQISLLIKALAAENKLGDYK